jgi:hypothetical protein
VTLPTPPAPSPSRPARKPSTFRARGLTAARNDHEAVATWLAKYTDNRHTLDSYRREAERLIAWAAWQGKDLPGLMVEDVLAYQAFLRDPQPVQLWCLQSEPRVLPDGAPNPLVATAAAGEARFGRRVAQSRLASLLLIRASIRPFEWRHNEATGIAAQ